MAPTSGFTLSALPRSPDVPANIGKTSEIDIPGIYAAVRSGLDAVESARNAPNRMILADNQAAESGLRRTLLGQEVQANPSILGARSRLLTSQANTADANLASVQSNRERETAMRQQAQKEMASLLQERDEANKLAGYNETAAAIGNLRVKYPWLSLPEYKDTLAKTLDEEQQAAMKQAASQGEQASRERIATSRKEGTVDAARLRKEAAETSAALRGGANALLTRQAKLIELVGEFPDDPTLAQQLDSVTAVLRNMQATERRNPNAARVTPPAGALLLKYSQEADTALAEAQDALDTALAGGVEEEIDAAQTQFNRLAKLAADAKREHELYHAERTKKISKGIDPAAIQSLAATLTGKKPATPAAPAPASSANAPKPLTVEEASEYLKKAGGDKNAARELARKDGRSF